MNKTLRLLTLSTLSLFAVFVIFVSFSHLYGRVLGYTTLVAIDFYIPTTLGVAATILTISTVIFIYRTTLPKHRKLFFSLSLIFFNALCITFIGNMIANEVFYLQNDHSYHDLYIQNVIRPKIVTSLVLLFLVLSIISFVLLFVMKNTPTSCPTKNTRMQAQIDELQKQVDELKQDE